ncbi:hypothetical protein DMC64_41780 [Amycolatopsis sp. WAC 04197]|uniref:hypothetical protein n=1 Tax=Amycolatopsis sp. WAC 04197 TaxID=2203199 RepID=UPI000F79085B|nr:hypothetical protein [Amycolatopsis sp. WAC 04197]RSN38599.1 hypothetical protein DMC64_41780 [Amycolatopsis sp. WAC 04197]
MTSIPYPHARHDCTGCRELDADVEMLDENGRSFKPPRELCRKCLGNVIPILAFDGSGPDMDQPVTVKMRPAAGRRA